MSLDYSYYSHIGGRKNNEDAACVCEMADGLLACVADGLGGHKNGEYASQQAIETVRSFLNGKQMSEEALENAIVQANADIYTLQERWPEAKTTIAVLWIQGDKAIAANVGDTRIYRFHRGEIAFQSTDHSLAQLAVIAGDITPQEIRAYPQRNVLTRSLGKEEAPWIDITTLCVEPGDKFLVCSDGFWEEITEEKMLLFAQRSGDPQAWLHEMRTAVQPIARDNNTAIVITIS